MGRNLPRPAILSDQNISAPFHVNEICPWWNYPGHASAFKEWKKLTAYKNNLWMKGIMRWYRFEEKAIMLFIADNIEVHDLSIQVIVS